MADELRGGIGGWEFKSYVLGTMFYRYISENLTNYINAGEIEAGNEDFDYAKLSDEAAEEAREGPYRGKGFLHAAVGIVLQCSSQSCTGRKPERDS